MDPISTAPTIQKFGNDVVVAEPSSTNTQNYTVLDSDMAKKDYLTKNKFLDQEQQNYINQSMINQQNSQVTKTTADTNKSADANTEALNKASTALTSPYSNGKDSSGGLNSGYTDVNGQLTYTGNSGSSAPSTGDPYVDKINQQNADLLKQYSQTQSQLQAASTTAGLSSAQQSQLSSLAGQYDTLISNQTHANDVYNSSVTMGTIRSGSNRYATAIAASTVAQAVNTGIAKISDLTNKKQGALEQMKQGFISDNVKAVNDAYKAYSDMSKQITDNIKTIQTHINDLHTQQVADANLALNQKTYDLNQQKAQETINKDLNITSPFYQLPGSPVVYDSKTGQQITSDQYAKMGGVGQGGKYSDIQVVDPSVNEKHSAAYTEWQDAVSTGYKGSFTQYENEDANRKATRVTNINSDPTKTFDLQTKQAPAQVANLKSQGYNWGDAVNYFNALNLDVSDPSLDNALHKAYLPDSEYQKWKVSNYSINHGVAP